MAKVNRHGTVSNNPAKRWVGNEKLRYCGPHNLHYRSREFAVCPQCALTQTLVPECDPADRTVYQGTTVAVWDTEPTPEGIESEDQKIPDARTWARENGYEVRDSGPLPKAVKEAYEHALDKYYRLLEKPTRDDLRGRNGVTDGV